MAVVFRKGVFLHEHCFYYHALLVCPIFHKQAGMTPFLRISWHQYGARENEENNSLGSNQGYQGRSCESGESSGGGNVSGEAATTTATAAPAASAIDGSPGRRRGQQQQQQQQ